MNISPFLFSFATCALITMNAIGTDVIINQSAVAGGGTSRWSQLWQDPGPNGNDLDGDSVCFADFSLTWPASIENLEWWGGGACELGFQIEIWKQDPGTVAYQPLGLFYYGGDHTVRPEARFSVTPADYSTATEAGLTHFTLDLSTPIQLAANNAANPRWFLCVIGLTQQAYHTFNWAQGSAAVPQTFQFIRGGTSGSGPLFRRLGDARSLFVTGRVDSPPQMRISLIDPQTAGITWDAAKTGYRLVTTASLPAGNWGTVTNAVSVVDGQCAVRVQTEATQFLQLVK
jgi:hypothetical protein